MIADASTLWWETMAGPQILIMQTADLLSEGKSVLLRISDRLSWQEQMRDILAHQLSTVQIEQIELSWDNPQQLIPQLLRQLRPSKASLCPPEYKAQLAYLKEKQIFHDSVVWIQPTQGSDLLSAVRFLSDFRGKGLDESGCFVLEIPESLSLPRLSSTVAVLDCNQSIRPEDVRLFASILADMMSEIEAPYRRYIAQLAANLANRNAQLVPALLQYLHPDEEPAQSIASLDQDMPFVCDSFSDSAVLGALVWKAQLQTVFADIEMARIRIVTEWETAIEQALQTEYWDSQKNTTGYIEQLGERLTLCRDVELGTLVYMMALRCSENHEQYLLYIPDEQTREWICFLRGCRNKLAHHNTCSPQEMQRLLTGLSEEK